MEQLSERYFFPGMSNREHAIFEVGIKLAALFHLLIGAPIKNDVNTLKKITEGLKESIGCQPFVKRMDVEIKSLKEGMGVTYTKRNEFDYTYISGKNLVAEVEVQYQDWVAIGRVEWISDLYYPLMYVKEVRQVL